MKCKNCGNENNEGAKYCSKCGENLEFQKDKKSSDKKLMIILSVIIAIIIILILVIALIFKNQSLNVTINNNDLNKITQESKNKVESNEYKEEQNNESNNDDATTNNIKMRKLNIVDEDSTSILTDSFKKDYGPYKVLDGDKTTVWAEGVDGPGYGESITLYFDSVHTVKQLKIVNGLINSYDGYYKNNRVASIKIIFSDGSSQIAHLSDDNTGYQTIDLGRSVDTDYITLTIDSVYSGYKYDDTCIAEVVVLGY